MPLSCLSEQLTRCDWWAEIDVYVTVKLNLFPEGNVHQIPFILVWGQIFYSGEHTHLSALSTFMETVIFMHILLAELNVKITCNFPSCHGQCTKAEHDTE